MTGSYIGVAVRVQPAEITAYFLYTENNTVRLYEIVDGSFTLIWQDTGWNPQVGWRLRLEVTGSDAGDDITLVAKEDQGGGWSTLTTISNYNNGTCIAASDPWSCCTGLDTGTCAEIDGGSPGLSIYHDSIAVRIDDWAGGDL